MGTLTHQKLLSVAIHMNIKYNFCGETLQFILIITKSKSFLFCSTPDMQQSEKLMQQTNVNQQLLEIGLYCLLFHLNHMEVFTIQYQMQFELCVGGWVGWVGGGGGGGG